MSINGARLRSSRRSITTVSGWGGWGLLARPKSLKLDRLNWGCDSPSGFATSGDSQIHNSNIMPEAYIFANLS